MMQKTVQYAGRSRGTLGRPLIVSLLLLCTLELGAFADDAPPPPSAQSGWMPYKVKHGFAVERRPVSGSRFFEYRVAAHSPLPPEAIIEKMWNHVTEATALVKKRQVLKKEPTELVLYDQIQTPVVSDRDYTLLVRKRMEPDRHSYQLTFETANHLGPPVDPHFVRIPAIRGSWSIEPGEGGGSRLTYRTYSEPGGSVPAFMIHGAQVDQAISNVEGLLNRLSKQG